MFELSKKYIDFCNTINGVSADFLEGTTASGKTTVGASIKFMFMVSLSDKKQHIIASKTTGTAEKNIIQSDHGILSFHPDAAYYGNGNANVKIPHIEFEGKIIYVLGYDDVTKWKMVLGSQFGCAYIDEVNTANIEFVRELSTRNDYLMATLNPDDPNLPVYKEFVNRSRPYKKYQGDVPVEILNELNEPAVPGWKYWFFSFKDNMGLSEADIQKKKLSAPPGTKLYKNKILGLRGRATGLVFPNFDRKEHVVTREWVKNQMRIRNIEFEWFSAGLDTSYSQMSEDTIAMIFQGITKDGRVIVLEEKIYNNKLLSIPLAPSDTAEKFISFLDMCCNEWGIVRNVFIDNADQATITELEKYKRRKGCIYIFNNSYKKVTIMDRIKEQLSWIQQGCYLVCEHCTEHIRELESYSWKDDKDVPEDRNDHTINSSQYAWIPYRKKIGKTKGET